MKQHVFIVDDELTLLRNLGRSLARQEFAVTEVATGAEARAVIASDQIDLICLDVALADDDGLELLAEIRLEYPHLPVIVMTAHDSAPNRERAKALDANAFLTKPFSLKRFRELVAVIANVDGGSPSTPEAFHAAPCQLRQGGRSVMMYSHDSIGLGHMRRNSNIAARLVQEVPDLNVLMVVGCPVGLIFDLPPRVDFMKLPSIAKVARDTWESGKLSISKDLTRELRANLIQRAVEIFQPDLFLVDHVPAGVWGELLPTLDFMRRQQRQTKTVLGLREILDTPEILRKSWADQGIYDVLDRYYDDILIYGNRDIYDTAREYGLDTQCGVGARYCGYLSSEQLPQRSAATRAEVGFDKDRLIVVTAGGGLDAYPFMANCMGALEGLQPAERPAAVFITGPLMKAEERADLERRAGGLPVRVLNCVPNLADYLQAADLVVTMGGYNTLVESVRMGRPTLVIPRKGPSAEQQTRSRVFSEFGLVRSMSPDDVTPMRLADLILECLNSPQPPRVSLGINGVAEAVRNLKGLLDTGFSPLPRLARSRLAGG